jgi:transcriptional antiterminator NusG
MIGILITLLFFIVIRPFIQWVTENTVESIDEEKGQVEVLINIFGRETPVELDFLQVEKA